ncbi:MAG: YheU family protein [Pseudobdellovibrionaceae bacterium]
MKQDQIPPVEIPSDNLSEDALRGLLESYILRDGTDYGINELSLENKLKNLYRQLERKEILIVFDLNTESATVLTQKEWKRITAQFESESH